MGKGANSCLKIMACGRDPTDNDELEVAEVKASPEKRRWSFRKRSAKNRVLSNNVIAEPISVTVNSKESPEAANNYFHTPKNAQAHEKIPVVKFAEEIASISPSIVETVSVPPTIAEPAFVPPPVAETASVPPPVAQTASVPPALIETVSETEAPDFLPVNKDTIDSDSSIDEDVVVVIQTAIRGYLAQKDLLKLKNVIKLQATVRGHLVRREAVGTLRCVQAIVKMQSLIRARRMRQSAEKGKEISSDKKNKVYSSNEKLLTNGFARQLLESTPSKKPIHISCDPSRSDSAWKWLERWMAITSSDVGPQQELNTITYDREQEVVQQDSPVAQVTGVSFAADCKADVNEKKDLAKDLINDESDLNESRQITSSPMTNFGSEINDDQEQPHVDSKALGVEAVSHTNDSLIEADANSSQIVIYSDATQPDPLKEAHLVDIDKSREKDSGIIKENSDSNSSQIMIVSDTILQPDSLNEKHIVDIEKSKRTTKRMTWESQDNDGKKVAFGLRKSCNPAFAAVQSKFEELSSGPNLCRSISSCQETPAEARPDSLTPHIDTFTKSDTSFTEDFPSQKPTVQIATSECGTEISISSTLDSPDRSEAEGGEIVLEIGALERRDYNTKFDAYNAYMVQEAESIPNNTSTAPEVQEQKLEEADINSGNYISAVDSVNVEQLSTELDASDMQVQLENSTGQKAYNSSPDGSPRSHITATESYGTPSSQVTLDAKRSKTNKTLPSKKPRFQLTSKSPSNTNTESGARNSTEHLPKETENGKRRNSLGAGKPDHVDHEPRVSSSNSLPNYMQATESARAKVHASSSPKSSPDVHDKESYARKRHSLPLGNGKQISSPRMQRSTSQVQQSSKGNSTHSPQTSADRKKWQR